MNVMSSKRREMYDIDLKIGLTVNDEDAD